MFEKKFLSGDPENFARCLFSSFHNIIMSFVCVLISCTYLLLHTPISDTQGMQSCAEQKEETFFTCQCAQFAIDIDWSKAVSEIFQNHEMWMRGFSPTQINNEGNKRVCTAYK